MNRTLRALPFAAYLTLCPHLWVVDVPQQVCFGSEHGDGMKTDWFMVAVGVAVIVLAVSFSATLVAAARILWTLQP